MEFKVGALYVVDLPGEGHVTASLCGSEPPMIEHEGDRELVILRWRVEYQGLEYILVNQAILRPAESPPPV